MFEDQQRIQQVKARIAPSGLGCGRHFISASCHLTGLLAAGCRGSSSWITLWEAYYFQLYRLGNTQKNGEAQLSAAHMDAGVWLVNGQFAGWFSRAEFKTTPFYMISTKRTLKRDRHWFSVSEVAKGQYPTSSVSKYLFVTCSARIFPPHHPQTRLTAACDQYDHKTYLGSDWQI